MSRLVGFGEAFAILDAPLGDIPRENQENAH
jgi:hypothetical protein